MKLFEDFLKHFGKKGAGAIIKCTTTGRYLLGFRSGMVFEPYTWSGFGGKIDGKEDPGTAMLRELEEEIGPVHIKGKPKLIYTYTYTYTYTDGGVEYKNYLVLVDKEFDPYLNWENTDADWFALNDFPKPLHFGIKELLIQNVLK